MSSTGLFLLISNDWNGWNVLNDWNELNAKPKPSIEAGKISFDHEK